jgi:hypothetical protein
MTNAMLRTVLAHALLMAGAWNSSVRAQVVVNEVCPRNHSVLSDDLGRHPDWVELWNQGPEPVYLDQYHLSDRPDQRAKWRLPNLLLPPGGHVVFMHGDTSMGPMYFPFKLSGSGEAVHLSNSALEPVHTLVFPELRSDHSYGLVNGVGRFFDEPTPGGPNTTPSYAGYTTTPSTNPQPGYHAPGTNIHVVAPAGTTVRVTSDGRFADAASSAYTDPFVLEDHLVVNAIAISPGMLPSKPFTGSFFAGRRPELPVVSISTHPDSLFHEDLGLFMLGPDAEPEPPHWGANFWRRRHLPVHFEYFDDRGRLMVSQRVDLRAHGGSQARPKPQMPMRITARSRHGHDLLEFPFFKERGRLDKYKQLVLRNSSGDWCLSNFRDGSWHQLALHHGLNVDVLAFDPVAVYINGAYYGWMNLRERMSPHYLANDFGAHRDSILLMWQENEPIQGDPLHFQQLLDFILEHDMADPGAWAQVESVFDIPSFKDYMALEMFAGNMDWPANNVRYWKPSAGSGKWRYLLHDLDATMELFGWITRDVDMFHYVLVEKHWTTLSRLFQALLANPEFKRTFLNRLADLMNTSFAPESVWNEHGAIVERVAAEVQHHFDRWGQDPAAFDHHVGLMAAFAGERPDHVRQHVLDHFGLPNTVELDFEVFPSGAGSLTLNTLRPEPPFTGIYFNGNAIDLSVVPADGYRFRGWTYDREPEMMHTSLSMRRSFPESGHVTAWFDRPGTDLLVHPNPCTDQCTLGFSANTAGQAEIALYQAHGSVVHRASITAVKGPNKAMLDAATLAPGVYLAVVTVGGERHTARIVKLP